GRRDDATDEIPAEAGGAEIEHDLIDLAGCARNLNRRDGSRPVLREVSKIMLPHERGEDIGEPLGVMTRGKGVPIPADNGLACIEVLGDFRRSPRPNAPSPCVERS